MICLIWLRVQGADEGEELSEEGENKVGGVMREYLSK
jgi:hypothetical protein